MFINTDIYDGIGLLVLEGAVVIEGGSTLYPSPFELCSQTDISDGIGLLVLEGAVVIEGGSTQYPSPSELC